MTNTLAYLWGGDIIMLDSPAGVSFHFSFKKQGKYNKVGPFEH
jgi:hypothetical protein